MARAARGAVRSGPLRQADVLHRLQVGPLKRENEARRQTIQVVICSPADRYQCIRNGIRVVESFCEIEPQGTVIGEFAPGQLHWNWVFVHSFEHVLKSFEL